MTENKIGRRTALLTGGGIQNAQKYARRLHFAAKIKKGRAALDCGVGIGYNTFTITK